MFGLVAPDYIDIIQYIKQNLPPNKLPKIYREAVLSICFDAVFGILLILKIIYIGQDMLDKAEHQYHARNPK